jgi:hypothetical protein
VSKIECRKLESSLRDRQIFAIMVIMLMKDFFSKEGLTDMPDYAILKQAELHYSPVALLYKSLYSSRGVSMLAGDSRA